MRRTLWALSGALFGLGLLVSGMTNPARVQGWFDLAGQWDPTLAFVLGGALVPMILAWRIAARRGRALTGAPLPALPRQTIDARLLGGSALFGFGWALSGLCPGPALASASWSGASGATFVLGLVGGMGLWRAVQMRRVQPA